MTPLLAATTTVLIPFIPLLLPGVLLFARPQNEPFLITGTKAITLSLTIHTLALFLAALLGIPSLAIFILITLVTLALLIYWRQYTATSLFTWKILTFIGPLLCVYFLFAIPYLLNQDGLPTGDVQKSIFWANEINTTGHLPTYKNALTQLNRDPVDFYTPGLHALTAYLLNLSPQPFITVGLFAIALAAAASWLSLSYIALLFPQARIFIYLTTPLFLLTNIRFLRYIREPGYHFQNLAGELLLYLFIFFCLHLLSHPKHAYLNLILIAASAVALLITHQFSTFIAAFVSLPLILTFLYQFRSQLTNWLRRPLAPLAAIACVFFALILALGLGLHQKIPHLFTTNPHLLSLTPHLTSYPTLLGIIWTFLSLLGFILLIHTTYQHRQPIHLAFAGILLVLLALSQAPRLAIDIPPVRALFYIILPFSILAAYATQKIWSVITSQSFSTQFTLRALLLSTISIATYTSLTSAYAGSNPNTRTNSTLTAPEVTLMNHLATTNLSQAILVDDYNQRSASWLLLSQKPTFSRLASDLERIMDEAKQSPERYQLYLKHLDYEKIFNLGSRPETRHLLTKHNISHLTAIKNNNQDAFNHNPALVPALEGDQVQLFMINPANSGEDCPLNSLCHWLLRTSTLVNDLGDSEDTFAHLPASLRVSRLSSPEVSNNTTYRLSTAPLIPLVFNIGDYVSLLWDQDNNQLPDTDLELVVLFSNQPSSPLQLTTPSGQTYSLAPNQTLHLSARDLHISPQGFITLTIDNPAEQPLKLDLIALGLSQVP